MSVLSPYAEAEASQRAASDPAVSAFVAASAGSGKTRLLTDRLLRLMAGGARPERILCLTFTKAAAAEMALRLQRRLGEWVTLDDDGLRRQLRDLAIEPTETAMQRARALFAHVLDLPGGMRISTIHAFCESLLRRFPLEAEISPHFQLAETRDADETMHEVREAVLADTRPRGDRPPTALEQSLRVLAGLVTMDSFSDLLSALKNGPPRGGRGNTADLTAARRRVLGVTAADRAGVIEAAVRWPAETELRDAARHIADHDTGRSRDRAVAVLGFLGLDPAARQLQWPMWKSYFLTEKGDPRATSTLTSAKLGRNRPDLAPVLLAEAERIVAVENAACAADVACVSEALCALAEPLLRQFESRKSASGLLEFDDLIRRSTALLVDPGAAWVLYKLDGGLDHLLLDEVQDTSPEQWDITHHLTQEFFAGLGGSDTLRTVFAVGDRKQSIFSFQGADVSGFDHARDRLYRRVIDARLEWTAPPLNVSFRSTESVLRLVDEVFADPVAALGVVTDGEILAHRAVRADHAGCVELWPLTEAPEADAPLPWTAADRNGRAISAHELLAADLAAWIKAQTDGSVMLESRGRPVRPSDIMILLRQRARLSAALVRALKAQGVPVAGLDRMVLTEQPAVQDLIALCDSLLLPQDDLSFACVLTSPLGGLDDSDLMALAIGRDRPLWEVLRVRHAERSHWADAWNFFSALLARVDFTSPHALLAEALGSLGGRARLLGRLGHEAAEPIDELLNAALSYTRIHPPSLQGFLHWLRRSSAEIKREAEAAGDQVRILTVHGAKGLQAPLVILPDTTGMPNGNHDNLLWAPDRATGAMLPIWVPRGEFHCEATRGLRAEANRLRAEEYHRLLYVALTRAEDRLVICGAKPRSKLDDDCWYNLVARGMARLTGEPVDGSTRYETPQNAEVRPLEMALSVAHAPPPPCLGRPPPVEPARPMPLAPSRPEGIDLGSVPASDSPLEQIASAVDRFKRGTVIHALLQHLPNLPETAQKDAAQRFLAQSGNEMAGDDPDATVAEVMAILRHPDLAPLFGPGSKAEVPLTGVIGDVVIGGLVDRLVALPDRVLLADYKTNRRPPATEADTPVIYLRQMASYRAVLRTIFPDRPVQCALIWTREARVSLLPDPLLDPHQPGR